jgi:hypothetical protein
VLLHGLAASQAHRSKSPLAGFWPVPQIRCQSLRVPWQSEAVDIRVVVRRLATLAAFGHVAHARESTPGSHEPFAVRTAGMTPGSFGAVTRGLWNLCVRHMRLATESLSFRDGPGAVVLDGIARARCSV